MKNNLRHRAIEAITYQPDFKEIRETELWDLAERMLSYLGIHGRFHVEAVVKELRQRQECLH
jgi:hypothetical protein